MSMDLPDGASQAHVNAGQSATNLWGSLANKVALVTGASRGIGAATARALAREGAAVVLAARDERALALVASEIEAAGGRALGVPTDVGDPLAVQRLVAQTLEVFGQLDIAFNNAASGHMPAPLADISLDVFDSALRVALRGVFVSMKAELPAMLASGGGVIVNMSSTAGVNGVRGMAAYVAAKHGVIGLTKSAALDYAALGVRVNAVAPGPILTDNISALTDEMRDPIIRAVPMRRIGLPEEVASAVVWLCSDQASFVTGAVIPVDGGRLAGA